jgi:hypothetical protein
MGADVVDLVAGAFETSSQGVLEGEAGVIGAEGDAQD